MLIMWAVAGAWLSALEIRRNRREVLRARIRQEHLQRLNHSLHEQNIKFVEMAHRDALTGAINRHGIRDWLQDQARLVRWQLNHVSVLFIDIDYFKQVNDVYGHSLGDDLLREFALVISREIRESDKLVRWGGEEFVVFCAQTTLSKRLSLQSGFELKSPTTVGYTEVRSRAVSVLPKWATSGLRKPFHAPTKRCTEPNGLAAIESKFTMD